MNQHVGYKTVGDAKLPRRWKFAMRRRVKFADGATAVVVGRAVTLLGRQHYQVRMLNESDPRPIRFFLGEYLQHA